MLDMLPEFSTGYQKYESRNVCGFANVFANLEPWIGGLAIQVDYDTDVSFSVEHNPLNIAVNIQWILTWNYSCHNMPIQNF